MHKEGLEFTLTLLRIPVRDWTLLHGVTWGQCDVIVATVSPEKGGGHGVTDL